MQNYLICFDFTMRSMWYILKGVLKNNNNVKNRITKTHIVHLKFLRLSDMILTFTH